MTLLRQTALIILVLGSTQLASANFLTDVVMPGKLRTAQQGLLGFIKSGHRRQLETFERTG